MWKRGLKSSSTPVRCNRRRSKVPTIVISLMEMRPLLKYKRIRELLWENACRKLAYEFVIIGCEQFGIFILIEFPWMHIEVLQDTVFDAEVVPLQIVQY